VSVPRVRLPGVIRWTDDEAGLVILDQTRLPEATVEVELRSVDEIEEAILSLRVRGAPLIGVTAAMGIAALATGWRARAEGETEGGDAADALVEAARGWCERLAGARPTAVNLTWAVRRMRAVLDSTDAAVEGGALLERRLREEATAIRDEDRAMCRRIGEHAADLFADGCVALTHCNAGALATAGIGTALAPIYVAHERGRTVRVFADETRPLLQGSRLTAWELERAGVDVTVVTDNTAATLMAAGGVDLVIVGADRIAANGDVANKVGTYALAVLARHHGIPFYVAAPTSTVDRDTPSGAEIPIEQRSADEVRRGFGRLTAPAEVAVWSPAFDVTPAALITAIVTDRGIHRPPYERSLGALFQDGPSPAGRRG